jgi:hypothetical protein
MLSDPSPSFANDSNYVNPGPEFTTGFAGFNGKLTMGNGASLETVDFYTRMTLISSPPDPGDHEFILDALSACDIAASGNVTVNETFANVANSTLTMKGHGKELAVRSREPAVGVSWPPRVSDVKLGNFVAAAGGTTEADATVINSAVVFAGEAAVTIASGSSLRTYPNAYIQVDPSPGLGTAKWTQTGAAFHLSGTPVVEFGVQGGSGRTFEISGNTVWYDLVCKEPTATLAFSNFPDLHSVVNEFLVLPLDAGGNDLMGGGGVATHPYMILLTRLTDIPGGGTYPQAPNNDATAPPSAVDNNFWYFELGSGARMEFNYVYIYYSWAKNRIPLPTSGDKVIIARFYVSFDGSGNPNYTLGDPRNDTTPNLGVAVTQSYYCHNWLVATNFFYSFTEDVDGNGRIERIRAQAAFDLTGEAENSFDHFKVVVDGYEVTGFARVDEDPDIISNPSITAAMKNSMKDMIYIYLREKDYSDTGTRLTWWVEENGSLRDLATKSIEIGLPEHPPMTAWDTAPPRINYALTVPEARFTRPGVFINTTNQGEIYVQFSEPVVMDGNVTGPPVSSVFKALPGSGDTEMLIPLTTPYTIGELAASSSPTFTVSGFRDKAEYVKDERSLDNPYSYLYPSPKYPVDWTYTGYVEVTGNGLSGGKAFDTVPPSGALPNIRDWATQLAPADQKPGNLLDNRGTGASPPYGTDTHRVTDILISVPPTALAAINYFVWPLWAKYQVSPFDGSALPDPDGILGTYVNTGYGFMGSGASNMYNDRDIIWDFSGKRFLEASSYVTGAPYDTTMQAKSGAGLLSDKIVYAFNIDSGLFKARARGDRNGHGSPGLWMPAGTTEYAGMAPAGLPVYSKFTAASPNPTLFNYNFTVGTDDYGDKKTLEFLFHVSGTPADLYAARMDVDAGISQLPLDWYYRVRPFIFGIHNITRQRSDATVLNNVINPTTGERVYLDYDLKKPGRVTIQVFTLDGNLVKVLERKSQPAGRYRVSWDGKNNGGRIVARGMYFIRIVAPDIDEIRKVMVVK